MDFPYERTTYWRLLVYVACFVPLKYVFAFGKYCARAIIPGSISDIFRFGNQLLNADASVGNTKMNFNDKSNEPNLVEIRKILWSFCLRRGTLCISNDAIHISDGFVDPNDFLWQPNVYLYGISEKGVTLVQTKTGDWLR